MPLIHKACGDRKRGRSARENEKKAAPAKDVAVAMRAFTEDEEEVLMAWLRETLAPMCVAARVAALPHLDAQQPL